MSILSRLWRKFCLMLGNQPTLTLYFLPLLQLMWPGKIPSLYRAKLLKKEWQTPDILQLTFSTSNRWPGFIPGQHVLLTIEHNGRYLSRPFSICSPLSLWKNEGQISLCCKVNKKGEFTPLLGALAQDCNVSISKAEGEFYWQNPSTKSVFIGAGSGITPLASMLFSQTDWSLPVTLFYRSRGEQNAALLMQLKELAAKQPLFTLHLSDSNTESVEQFEQLIVNDVADKQFYVCGPSGFMKAIKTLLNQHDVPSQLIFQEQFGFSMPLNVANESENTLNATFVKAGQAYQVSLDSQKTLLQNAEDGGLTPQFGCRIGVCFQCVCDKVSGQVRDLRTGELSGNGAEQIQLCVSQPVSEVVIKL